ncbi:MAG: dihydroorotate dehydrogenase, partial [Acidimicrobiales bacterium]
MALSNPVMTASGTAGHSDELAAYGSLASLGAHVVKSLAARPWAGNPPPRVTQRGAGMLNSVGLAGPGLEWWLENDLPRLVDTGVAVVVSIWGASVADFANAAQMLTAHREGIV